VIHFHNVSLVGGPGVLRYGRGLKLYTMHEHWLICPAHILFKNNREVCRTRNCFTCQIAHRRPPQLWRYTRLLKAMTSHVDAFIAPSQFVRAQHENRRGREIAPDARIVVLPNFVPQTTLPSPSPVEARVGESARPYFLYVGRLEKLKGVQTLIPVFLRYRGAALIIAGSGSAEPHLRRLAGLSDNIHFLGHQPSDQIRTLMRSASALLVPSICFETFPTVTLEAFSEGTPAIVRDIGSLPEQIEHSKGGFVYRSDEELVAAMDGLLESPGLRDHLGQRALEAYRKRWAPEPHIKRYLHLIEDLSARRAEVRGGRDEGPSSA
jgi:glycosyltransferase involved in cell wall biosynthesis